LPPVMKIREGNNKSAIEAILPKDAAELAAHGPAALKAQTSGHELPSAMYVSLKHMSEDKADIERLHRIKTWLSEISAWPAPD
jgi:hypothetical protein